MNKSKNTAYTVAKNPLDKPLNIKEWAIEHLKLGLSPKRIAEEIKILFKQQVTMMTVYRWRKRYIEVTGDNIPGWHKVNLTAEQKEKNKTIYPKPKKAPQIVK